jgi:glycerophosphoryl diester phosphodiesterase
VEIIAHRGASYDAPENTLPAFQLAWEQGADAIECDIHQTKDGQILVIHDANTKHLTGVKADVANTTLAELRTMDAGRKKGRRWKGTRLPTLPEVLDILPENKRLFIEIKCGPEVLPELERVLKNSRKKPRQMVLIGFDYATMMLAKDRLPNHEACWIAAWKRHQKTRRHPRINDLIAMTKLAGLDGLDLDHKFPMDAAFVSQVVSAGLKLYTWTVDKPREARRLIAAGLHGITTNRPGWLRERLG